MRNRRRGPRSRWVGRARRLTSDSGGSRREAEERMGPGKTFNGCQGLYLDVGPCLSSPSQWGEFGRSVFDLQRDWIVRPGKSRGLYGQGVFVGNCAGDAGTGCSVLVFTYTNAATGETSGFLVEVGGQCELWEVMDDELLIDTLEELRTLEDEWQIRWLSAAEAQKVIRERFSHHVHRVPERGRIEARTAGRPELPEELP